MSISPNNGVSTPSNGTKEIAELSATPEPDPVGDDETVLEHVALDLVDYGYPNLRELFVQRAEMGHKKYGTYLRVNNGRNAINDAIQEAIDLCMYAKQAQIEQHQLIPPEGQPEQTKVWLNKMEKIGRVYIRTISTVNDLHFLLQNDWDMTDH